MKAVLSNQNIDLAVKEAENYFKTKKVDRKKLISITLWLEEALAAYQEAFGEDAVFTMNFGHLLGSFKINLKVRGDSLNPFDETEDSDDPFLTFLNNIDVQFGNKPRWSYTNKTNTITFVIGKITIPDYFKIFAAIAGGILVGILLRAVNEPLALTLQEQFFTPVGSTVLGLINAVAVLMIFVSVIWGICSIGDASTFSVIGKKLGAKLLLYYALAAILALTLILIGLDLNYGQTISGSTFTSLFQMLLDIVPKNLFTPFTEGNTLQILFIAIIFGVALIILGEKADLITKNLEQLNFLVQDVMEMVGNLIPVFVFCSMYEIAATSKIETVKAGGKFFLFSVIGLTLLLLLHFVILMLQTHLSPGEILKKSGKSLSIAFSTASSTTALPQTMSACIEGYHVKEEFVRFAGPLTTLVYYPDTFTIFLIAAFTAAESSGTLVSLSWIINALIVCFLITVSTPPGAGGYIACLALVFTQLGLPQDHLAVIMALTVILDFYTTAVKVLATQCLIVDTSNALGEKRENNA